MHAGSFRKFGRKEFALLQQPGGATALVVVVARTEPSGPVDVRIWDEATSSWSRWSEKVERERLLDEVSESDPRLSRALAALASMGRAP